MKRTGRKLAVGLAWVCLVVLAGLVSLPLAVYAWGLAQIPGDRFEAPRELVPPAAIRAFWFSSARGEQPQMRRGNPYRSLRRVLPPPIGVSLYDGEGLAALAARTVLLQDLGSMSMWRWHLIQASGEIWISRHWSVEQVISAFLNAAYFGHGFRGLQAAAQGYFGAPVDALNTRQLAYLMVLTRVPAKYDPWCRPERAESAARRLLERLGADPELPLGLLAAPPDACAKRHETPEAHA